MASRKGTPADQAALRACAEERLRDKRSKSEAAGCDSAADTQRLVHELQVHQIELELQNEELQAARAELEIGLARYSELYDFAPVGYATLDDAGTIQTVNLAGALLLGRERARLVAARLGLFVSTESRPAFAAFLRKVFSTRCKEICEIVLCPGKREPIWVHVEAAATDGGRECRAVLLDVTERKRAEAALARSEQHFGNLFQSMDEGFALCEMIHDEAGQPVDFRYLEVNPAFSRQTGLPAERIVGRTAKEVIPRIEPHWIEFFDRVLRTGLPQRVENRLERLDKQFEVHAWRADAGRFAATFNDVTEQRQTEEHLRDAQRMEAIGRLAGGIAHDFNNMLAIILNYAEFAMEDMTDGDPLRNNLAEIHKAADRATTLTRQLLAFSRRQILRPRVIDLNKIVDGMAGMLRRLLGEDISLSVVLAPGLGRVMADPGQVEQVVMNLAVNARDAMPDGGKLTIETADLDLDEAGVSQHAGAKPGPHVMLSVTDTGCGMNEKTCAHLYEPFFTTKAVGKGTGLGLATVYGIVKQSGGTIGVRSELGEGTTFTVLFPCELSPTEMVARTAGGITRAGADETILIVEDEEVLRALGARILGGAGYTVLTAANGREALVLCEQRGAIDLVLTDVVMPEMGGKELADRLVQSYPAIRILFMSGYPDEAIAQRGALRRRAHFIGKPFTSVDLTRAVRQVLDDETQTRLTGSEI